MLHLRNYVFLILLTTLPLEAKNSSSQSMQDIIHSYSSGMDISMQFKKTTTVKLLKKTISSKGVIFLSKLAMALKIEDTQKTRVVLKNKRLWYMTCVDDVPEVIELKADKNLALILSLFQKTQFFKFFSFVSSHTKGRAVIREFKPTKPRDIQALSIKTEGSIILAATIVWKNGNKEEYQFSDIRRKQTISDKHFQVVDKKLTCF